MGFVMSELHNSKSANIGALTPIFRAASLGLCKPLHATDGGMFVTPRVSGLSHTKLN